MLPSKGDIIVFRERGEFITAIGYVISRETYSLPKHKKKQYIFQLLVSGEATLIDNFLIPVGSNIKVYFDLKQIRKNLRERKWQIIYNTNPLQKLNETIIYSA